MCYLCALLLFSVLCISLLEIFRRYIMKQSFVWADEFIRYSIVAIAVLGGACAYHRPNGLVNFDLIMSHIWGKARLVVTMLVNTMCLTFSLIMMKNAISTVQKPSIKNQISVSLDIPMAWAYMPIIIGLGMFVLFSLEKYYDIAMDFRNGLFNRQSSGERGESEA